MQTRSAEALARAYTSYYQGLASGSQRGGAIPVFRGKPYQYGNGLGAIFQSIFRTVFPIVAPILGLTAARFASETIGGIQKGKRFGDAAKAALKPAGETLLTGALKSLNPPMSMDETSSDQSGSGRKRKSSGGVYKASKKRRRSKSRKHKSKKSKSRRHKKSKSKKPKSKKPKTKRRKSHHKHKVFEKFNF